MLGGCSVSVVGTGGVSLPPVTGSGDVEVQTPVGKQRTCTSRDEIMGFYTYTEGVSKALYYDTESTNLKVYTMPSTDDWRRVLCRTRVRIRNQAT